MPDVENNDVPNDDDLEQLLENLYVKLLTESKPMSPEFAKILSENIMDLF